MLWLRLILVIAMTSAGAVGMADAIDHQTKELLLQKAKDWHVPQPPASAVLVKVHAFDQSEGSFFFQKNIPRYVLGFRDPTSLDRLLIGSHDVPDRRVVFGDAATDVKPVLHPDQLRLNDIEFVHPFLPVTNDTNIGLIVGIQLLRRGEEKLGLEIIERASHVDSGNAYSPFYSPEDEPLLLMLARTCLAATLNEISSPHPDFPEIDRRIKCLLGDEPRLKSEGTDAILKCLQENLSHQTSPPGTIARSVDDYLMGDLSHSSFFGLRRYKYTLSERSLIEKGFDAVPFLLKERHTNRLTNHVMSGFDNFPSYAMRSGAVIDDYLSKLANLELEDRWHARGGGQISDEAIEKWWREAQAVGEKEYIRQHFIAFDDNNKPELSGVLLYLAQVRHPELLPEIYRKTREFKMYDEPVLEAILTTLMVFWPS